MKRLFKIIGTDGKPLPDLVELAERQNPKGVLVYYEGNFYHRRDGLTPSIDLRYPVPLASLS